MTTPELLPCPFCGGEARSRIYEDDHSDGFASAECVSCGADIRLAVFWMDNGEKEQAEAIAAWNTRAPLSPAVLAELPEVREAIAEALLAAHKEIRGMDTEKDEDLNYNLAVLRCAEKLRTRAAAIREARNG